jgi:hypothetical protein
MIHSSFLCLCALESSFITKTGDLVQFGCFINTGVKYIFISLLLQGIIVCFHSLLFKKMSLPLISG